MKKNEDHKLTMVHWEAKQFPGHNNIQIKQHVHTMVHKKQGRIFNVMRILDFNI